MTAQAIADPIKYASAFGNSGTYQDFVQEIAAERGNLNNLLNINLTKDELYAILREAGFTAYRLDGALAWITETISLLSDI